MKKFTDKMRLDFIEASAACIVTDIDGGQWAVSFNGFATQGKSGTHVNSSVHKDEFKSTLREAIDAAMLEDATYN